MRPANDRSCTAPGVSRGIPDHAKTKFTYPDGGTEDISTKAGQVMHMDAFTHLPENTSKKAFEVIQVELKG
jgi:hypothetical protein